ncbi:MAG: hypothetical protein CL685_01470 [Candidatus Magasanikbacteria bacterium]|nr:hypothetical protein [Candidatus Magasanikbacteria bacterium]|tara:strand:+ start:2279 stop:3016 length:738 start_codon:yes stop_codon:yes gene_type:complete
MPAKKSQSKNDKEKKPKKQAKKSTAKKATKKAPKKVAKKVAKKKSVSKKTRQSIKDAAEQIPSLIIEHIEHTAPPKQPPQSRPPAQKPKTPKSDSYVVIQKKKRVMWISVSVFMVIIIALWGITIKSTVYTITHVKGSDEVLLENAKKDFATVLASINEDDKKQEDIQEEEKKEKETTTTEETKAEEQDTTGFVTRFAEKLFDAIHTSSSTAITSSTPEQTDTFPKAKDSTQEELLVHTTSTPKQ